MNPAPSSMGCPTGVPGLDDVLCGGLPPGGLYLVEGDPGAGKTTLGLQFLLEGMRQGEQGLYVTLSESSEELRKVAQSHGWSLEGLSIFDLSMANQQLEAATDHTFFHPSEVELNRLTQALVEHLDRVKPVRMVFDCLSELRLLSETGLRLRRQVLSLKHYFAGHPCTSLLLEERIQESSDFQLRTVLHGVVSIELVSPAYGVTRRRLSVLKMRGWRYREGYHDALLKTGGLVVFPRLAASEHPIAFQRQSFAIDIEGLDALLGGGLDRGTSTIFMGSPGTGKSTLAMKYAHQATLRGERASVYLFDETLSTLLARAKALGMDLEAPMRSGLLRLQPVDPAAISPGELTYQIWQEVKNDAVRMIIIDSLNGYLNTVPEERYLNLQLHELLAFLNQQGVITIMVLAQHGLVGAPQTTVELTYLADTIVLLRHFEALGEVRQAISVLKKRSGRHERTVRELLLDGDGIRVGAPLKDFQGVLGGNPQYHGYTGAILPSVSSSHPPE